MKNRKPLKSSTSRISKLFSPKETKEIKTKRAYMRLNFLQLTRVFNSLKKEEGTYVSPLFTSNILSSDNPHLIEMTKQAHSCSRKQDLHLFSLKQFSLRNEFAMKRVIEWHLAEYMKSKEQMSAFIEIMKEASPETFRKHLFTLLGSDKHEDNQWEPLKRQTGGELCRVSKL